MRYTWIIDPDNRVFNGNLATCGVCKFSQASQWETVEKTSDTIKKRHSVCGTVISAYRGLNGNWAFEREYN